MGKSEVPVVLDLHAKWSEPCKKLSPILERETIAGNGEFTLMKIDIDKFPEIASSLKVRQIPFVVVCMNGNLMEGFTGYPTDEKLKSFFDTVYKISEKFVKGRTPKVK